MKTTKLTLLIGSWLFVCLMMFGLFRDFLYASVFVSIISILIALYTTFYIDDNHFSYSSVFLMYTIATQFGLVIPYVVMGKRAVVGYSDWTLKFLDSSYLPNALYLGSIAIVTFVLFKSMIKRKSDFGRAISTDGFDVDKSKKTYIVSIVLMLIVVMFFGYNIVTGGTSLYSTYEGYMRSSAYNSSIYSYILILFYVGTIYLSASGNIKTHKVGWFLWFLLVMFFALNGNKGEFMYSLLAVLGMKGIEGQKITIKSIGVISLILFIVIPSITILRGVGIVGNIGSAQINFIDAFVEMGMQIRTSVYVLEDIPSGVVSFLYGESYYRPLINFIPFLKGPVATQELRSLYRGYGFNQVIESYMNFGVVGVLAFFGLLGNVLTRLENNCHDRVFLAYIGTITCILINATRNYFAFVPGQIVLVSIVYIVVRYLNFDKR